MGPTTHMIRYANMQRIQSQCLARFLYDFWEIGSRQFQDGALILALSSICDGMILKSTFNMQKFDFSCSACKAFLGMQCMNSGCKVQRGACILHGPAEAVACELVSSSTHRCHEHPHVWGLYRCHWWGVWLALMPIQADQSCLHPHIAVTAVSSSL